MHRASSTHLSYVLYCFHKWLNDTSSILIPHTTLTQHRGSLWVSSVNVTSQLSLVPSVIYVVRLLHVLSFSSYQLSFPKCWKMFQHTNNTSVYPKNKKNSLNNYTGIDSAVRNSFGLAYFIRIDK